MDLHTPLSITGSFALTRHEATKISVKNRRMNIKR